MAATTGPALIIGPNTFCGTDVFVGQGDQPIVRCRYTQDDVSVASPNWIWITDRMRGFSVIRGRSTELDTFDAGTASIALDNRDRALDPVLHTGVRPMNRVQLYAEFSGSILPIITAYAESWTQTWDESGTVDAVATLRAVDETKVLALTKLPTMSPPRDSYADYVRIDTPTGYWSFSDPSEVILSNASISSVTPIIGDKVGPFASGDCGELALSSSGGYANEPSGAKAMSGGTNQFTAEMWFNPAANSSGDTSLSGDAQILRGPATNPSPGVAWRMLHGSDGKITFEVRNGSNTTYSVTSTSALPLNAFTHVVGVVDGTTLRLYLNGAQNNTATFSGNTVDATNMVPGAGFIFGYGSATCIRYLDEVAVYAAAALPAARVLAHYNTAKTRGFPAGGLAGANITLALDSVASHAPRRIGAGARAMQGAFMTGQPPLDELRRAVAAEKPDGACFIAADGTIVFLDSAHRASSPYNTVQATFGDQAGELPYLDLQVDYSESFLANEWNVTKDGGLTQTASDATSISRYLKRTQAISDLPITSDSDAATIATALLAKYKDPQTRATALIPNMADPDTALAVLGLDLMDRIRVLRTPPGGGARFDQQLFVQSIQLSGSADASQAPGAILNCTLGVSPL